MTEFVVFINYFDGDGARETRTVDQRLELSLGSIRRWER